MAEEAEKLRKHDEKIKKSAAKLLKRQRGYDADAPIEIEDEPENESNGDEQRS